MRVAVTRRRTFALCRAEREKEKALKYVGIDIAKRKHAVAVREADGTPKGKAVAFTNDEAGFKALADRLSELEVDCGDCIIAMESTGHYWIALWSFLTDHGWPVAVVNPVLTDAFRRVDSLRKTKTDEIDAFLIAEFARFKGLGPESISPEVTDGVKQLTRYRAHLVKERTALKNRATACADRVFPELGKVVGGMGSATAKALLRDFGTPERIAKTDIRTLEKAVREASNGHFGRAKAEEVKAAARRSIGSAFAADSVAFELKKLVELIDYLDGQIDEVDAEACREMDQEVRALLTSIPGIGDVTAATIAAEMGAPERFDDPKKLVAFAGIDASKSDSGQLESSDNHMSKRGSSYLRYALMNAADRARMYDPYFGDYYDSMIARGKHHYVALSGVARKLCGVILAVLKEHRPYEPRPSIQSQRDPQTQAQRQQS